MSFRHALIAVVLFAVGTGPDVFAQGRGGAPMPPPPPARKLVPAEMAGNWVSYVTEDWRFRMITPPKGDYTRVPLTPEGRKTADGWNPAADQAAGEQCKAYGAAAIMRVPARFRIAWQDDNTLAIDSDAGMQRRTLHFAAASPPKARTWQGHSVARWDNAGRTMTVTTTNMRPGYLRRNGVPYSADASVVEYFVVAPFVDGEQMLIVTTVVEDPRFLQRPFVVSSHFKRDKDPSRWNPTPCAATW